jgi:hypothetical protein
MRLGQTYKWEFKMKSTCTTKKKGQLTQVEWKWRDKFNTSFTRLATHGRRHHSILIVYFVPFHGDYIQMPLFLDSQVGVPKLGFLLSQNFGHPYLSQIKSVMKMQGQYLITLENIFPTVHNMFQLDLIWLLFSRDLWLGIKFSIWFLPFLLIIIHAN